MSHREKHIIASIISSFLVFGIYYLVIFQLAQNGRFAGEDASSLLGRAILFLIAGGIVANIIVTILFSVGSAIVERNENPSFVVDERDRLIELRGMRFSNYLTGAGIIASMIALAIGQSIFVVLNMIIASLALSDIISNLLMLGIYRRGF